MVKNFITLAVIVGIIGGVSYYNSNYDPQKLQQAEFQAQMEAQAEIEAAKEAEQKAALEAIQEEAAKKLEADKAEEIQLAKNEEDGDGAEEVVETEAAPAASKEWEVIEEWPTTTPDTYRLLFECSNGNFVVECFKEWAPLGADRFYQLAREGFYNECRFFRVVPGFVVQWGINGDPNTTKAWDGSEFKDDKLVEGNKTGYITFANRGPNSRSTQVFINFKDNRQLDNYQGYGFPAFGKVIEGFDKVQGINAEYGQTPDQGLIRSRGNKYLEEKYPRMDYIKNVALVK